MSVAETVIEKFGGLTAMARALGHRHPTTVQHWKESGFIPARHQAAVLAAARAANIELNPAELIGIEAA